MKKYDPHLIKTIGIFVGEDLLGDGILKYPFVCALKDSFPNAKITWIAGHHQSVYGSLLSSLVEGKIECVLDQEKIGDSWRELFNPLLKPFDLFINTHQSLKGTFILKRLARHYFIDPSYHFLFSDLNPCEKIQGKHLTDKLMGLIHLLTKRKTHRDYPVNIPQDIEKEVTGIFNIKKMYVAISPGAGQKKKQWPLENFINVALEMVQKNRVPVFILGPGESHWYPLLKEAIPESLFPLQSHPHFLKDPLYTSAIAKHCHCAIANDSGTGHLLGLAAIPLISLFGPTSSDKLRPYTSKGVVINAQAFGGSDMACIPLESVLKTIEKVL